MNYAQLDQNGYCIGISYLSSLAEHENMIQINKYDLSYLGRKYDFESKDWTNEYKLYEEVRHDNRLDQLESAVGDLAEQLAKNTLLTGGNE